MNESNHIRLVTLKDIWSILVKRFWIVAAIAAFCVVAAYAVNRFLYVPMYRSTATLYILRQEDSDYSYSSSDFSMALSVVNDCNYLLKSHAVIDEVIDKLQLTMSYSELSSSISTSNPTSTRILQVSVVTTDSALSKQIVDCLCAIGVEKINGAMGFNQVNFYEYGTTSSSPCNKTSNLTYITIGAGVAVFTYAAFIIAFLLDDRLTSKEDVEKALGLSVLGEIPNFQSAGKKSSGYYGYGYRKKNTGSRLPSDEPASNPREGSSGNE